MKPFNLILATDSYKLNHWHQYPSETETVYSYFESRQGAKFPYTVFFGLQYLLKEYLAGSVVNEGYGRSGIEEAAAVAAFHFGTNLFNKEGWEHIAREHHGKLPLRIKAVPEGSVIPTGNVLMTVENTDPKCFWLTNAVESLLTHVWYPSTVATLSRATKDVMANALRATADTADGLPFMLHDFGYRGASSHESAAIGGTGHLVNFQGTDTLPALLCAHDYYGAPLSTLGFSVPATEHSVMTSYGKDGEPAIVERLLKEYPTGILSVVADSYNIYEFVEMLGSAPFYEQILARDGTFVVRPDSVTLEHPRPAELVVWILKELDHIFGSTVNSKGYKVLNPKVKVLWGDGIDLFGVEKILNRAAIDKYSAENLVFGMGGGLLQKVDRDTQRFAFKASAQKREGEWHDIYKEPLGSGKTSKEGRLALLRGHGYGFTESKDPRDASYGYKTVPLDVAPAGCDLLETVFENGEITKEYNFDEVRANANIYQKVRPVAA